MYKICRKVLKIKQILNTTGSMKAINKIQTVSAPLIFHSDL